MIRDRERTHPDVTIQTCWDSNRLDLGRVGIAPHPSRLCTEVAKRPETIKWADGRASFRVVPTHVLDDLVADIPDACNGFRLLFSSAPFPGFQRKLIWVREEMGGNWYRADQPPGEGWLCPALFRYFESAPAEVYVRAEALKR